MNEITNRGRIAINKAPIGYWWSIRGHFGPGAGGWRLTKQGAINSGRRFKSRYEERTRQYYNPDLWVD